MCQRRHITVSFGVVACALVNAAEGMRDWNRSLTICAFSTWSDCGSHTFEPGKLCVFRPRADKESTYSASLIVGPTTR